MDSFTKGSIEAVGGFFDNYIVYYGSKSAYFNGAGGAGTVSCGSIATGTYVEYTEE